MKNLGFFLVVFAVLSFAQTAAPTQPQQTTSSSSKDITCLEKEIADSTRLLEADSDRLKVGILAEDITWHDEYRRAAIDIIQSDFPNKFVAVPDQSIGVLLLYIHGTSADSNGAQFVDVEIQIFSDEMVLAENAKNSLLDLHLAKLGDPTRVLSGHLVLAENGVLLAPLAQGMNFELWHLLNLQKVRENIKQTLSDFAGKWEEAGKKK